MSGLGNFYSERGLIVELARWHLVFLGVIALILGISSLCSLFLLPVQLRCPSCLFLVPSAATLPQASARYSLFCASQQLE